MLLADSKKQENIIEYLLLMFQTETLVRALNFDVNKIFKQFIAPHIKDEKLASEYKSWYTNVAQELKEYGEESTVHVSDVNEVQMELFYLHNSLLNVFNDELYRSIYEVAAPIIIEFAEKSNSAQLNHVDMAVNALYAKLLLKMSGKEISAASEEAFEQMRKMLAHLARAYHKMKSGEMDFINN